MPDIILAALATGDTHGATHALKSFGADASAAGMASLVKQMPSPARFFLHVEQGGIAADPAGVTAFYDAFAEAAAGHLPAGDLERRLAFEHAAYAHACRQQWPACAAWRQRAYDETLARFGPDHADTRLIRQNLAFALRNAGDDMKHEALFTGNDTVCEHLAPALAEIKRQGGRVASVGTPWSQNCRTWVYFDNVVLDFDSLKQRLNLPACVTLTQNDDPRSGTESGLFCEEHHDALMGSHPDHARPDTKTIR